jgi:hypothetical protein
MVGQMDGRTDRGTDRLTESYPNGLRVAGYNNYFDEELFSLKQACVRTANLHTIK